MKTGRELLESPIRIFGMRRATINKRRRNIQLNISDKGTVVLVPLSYLTDNSIAAVSVPLADTYLARSGAGQYKEETI